MAAAQVKTKSRVANYGEVYTAPREANAMLDLVKQETGRIESRFLEPACGNGNFLIEILERKLSVCGRACKNSRVKYEWDALISLSTLYGIDILADNIKECRERLFNSFCAKYIELFGNVKTTELFDAPANPQSYFESAKFILSKNIIHGNALTLTMEGDEPCPIIFCEWNFLDDGKTVLRKDFSFSELLCTSKNNEALLFASAGQDAFIPKPEKEFPSIYYLKIGEMEK